MDRFRTIFGGGQANLADAPESVLGEWQKYSSDAAPPTQSDRLLGQMEAGGATLTNAFSSSLSAARTGISSAGATISGGATSATSLCAHLKLDSQSHRQCCSRIPCVPLSRAASSGAAGSLPRCLRPANQLRVNPEPPVTSAHC